MSAPVRILVVGLGNMGKSHARAYHRLDGFEIVGLMSRSIRATAGELPPELQSYPLFEDFDAALRATRPDAVSINTYPDTHAPMPCAPWMPAATCSWKSRSRPQSRTPRRSSPRPSRRGASWCSATSCACTPPGQKLIEIGRGLGKPLVMRMNLNQQSSGPAWAVHRN